MSRRSASPAEDAIHDLLQTMSQKERDARYDAKHKQLRVSVSRALENAAWTLDEFCNNDTDRQTVWTEISDGAQPGERDPYFEYDSGGNEAVYVRIRDTMGRTGAAYWYVLRVDVEG